MSDGNQAKLKRIIEEVFITPVRSVLLVDDEYPTVDKMLAGLIDKQDVWSKVSAEAKNNSSRVSNILSFCRERNWHVDVHDGENVSFDDETKSADNLQQSDLLFLDYHLDGDSFDTGKCIKILRDLSKSNHFNLVVVVTKEELEPAFRNILPNFIQTKFEKILPADKRQEVQTFIDDWSDESGEPIAEKLADCFSLDAYLHLASFEDIDPNNERLLPYLSEFKTIIESSPSKGTEKNVLLWSLAKAEIKLNITGTDEHERSSLDADQKWLCHRNLFMTIVKKSEENQAELILEALTTALMEWNPTANRLILSKIRSEIQKRGLLIEQEVFKKRHMQALWFKNLVTSGEEERKSEIDISVRRYGEALVSSVSTPVREVITRSLGLEKPKKVHQRVQNAFGIDIATKDGKHLAAIEHNISVSNSKIGGWHIELGHIFKLSDSKPSDSKSSDSYWIVLTPACDLVPSQNRQRAEDMQDIMPFKAVKLRVFADKKALEKADHNLTIFIDDGDDDDKTPICLHFLTAGASNSEVHWNEFFAKNRGKFSKTDYSLSVATAKFVDGKDFQNDWACIKIIAQLRPEYAIHLLQTLGSRTSRIGLGFVNGK